MSFIIFIVDDDPKDLKSIERMLQQEDFILKTFISPIEALAEIEKVKAHLIISDRKMPHMDGTDFLKRVKEKYPDCYCILISGSPISTTEENALAQGKIEHFFPKPLDAELFLSRIKQLLKPT
ncbi:MAG: response regulator [Pseudomonadota bacterium]